MQLNALQLVIDSRSLVWLNLFALDLRHSLEQFMELYKLNDLQKPDEHIDIRVDGLMLKVKTSISTVLYKVPDTNMLKVFGPVLILKC